MLSTRTKESLKTALAITVTFAIALYMDWDKAYWAAFAVAFCSLATIGQSINKAALRMLGTFLAIIVAFTLIALFAQHRWPFIFFLSLWLGFCTYMGSGPKFQYFWMIAGLVSAVIAVDAGPHAANAFTVATLRAQETALGVFVYTLISLFIWPTSSGPPFLAAASTLASTQRRLFGQCLDLLSGGAESRDAQSLAGDEATARKSLDVMLTAAQTDDLDIRGQRSLWHKYQQLTSGIGEALAHWRESLAEYQDIDLRHLIPGLDHYRAELDARFAQIESLLAGKAPDRDQADVSIAIDRSRLDELSHFQKAALAVIQERMETLDSRTKQLVAIVAAIKGFEEPVATVEHKPRRRVIPVPDIDRAASAVRLALIVWMGWLALIYIDGLPGGSTMVVVCSAIGMNLAVIPQLKVRQIYRPVAFGMLLGAVFYIFVMPQLSSFLSLGAWLFGVTFILCYRFSEPQQALDRALGLALFILVAAIDNQQAYSFLSVAIAAMMFPPFFLIMSVTEHFPVSLQPEKSFLRLSSRFFRSCEYLVATMGAGSDQPRGRLDGLRSRFHAYEVSTLPGKLALWCRFIKPDHLPGTSPPQLQAMVSRMRQISRRLNGLVALRAHHQSRILVEGVDVELCTWRRSVIEILRGMSDDPNAAAEADLRNRLSSTMQRLEEQIVASLDAATEDQFTEQETSDFYRLLGAYRGVSEALVGFAGRARDIQWAPWHEERFA